MSCDRYTTGYIKYILDHEFKKIEEYVTTKIRSPAMRMCIQVMMYLGLRAGEAVALRRQDFNNDFSTLTFKVLKRKKNNVKERKLQSKLSNKLRGYYRKHLNRMQDDYLFFANYKNQSKSKHIQRNAITAKFYQMRKKLNMEDCYYVCRDGKKLYRLSSHTMRHYAIWRIYIATGKDIRATQQIIGHIKIETTARYIYHIAAAMKEKEIMEKAFTIS